MIMNNYTIAVYETAYMGVRYGILSFSNGELITEGFYTPEEALTDFVNATVWIFQPEI